MRKKTNSKSTSEFFPHLILLNYLFLGLILFSKNFYPLWVLKAVLILYFIFQIPMALRNVGKPVSGASKKLQVDPQNDQNPSKNYGDIRKCKFREFLFQWELFC